MKSFNPKLEVGMLAMVIGVRQEKNSHFIGKIVTVEEFVKKDQDTTHLYDMEGSEVRVIASDDAVVVSGIAGHQATTKDQFFKMNPGWTHFDEWNLMPIPPLPEEEKRKELELVH